MKKTPFLLSIAALAVVLSAQQGGGRTKTATTDDPFAAVVKSTRGAASADDKPWTSFKLPKTKVQLNFRNANADLVLSYFQKVSGVTIVKDPTLTGGLTVTTAKPVSIDEAFSVLSAYLGLKNFTLKKQDTFLIIAPKPQNQGNPFAAAAAAGGDNPFGGGGRSNSVLRVYPIKFASASEVARVVNDVYSDSGNQQQGGFPFFFGGGQRRNGGGGNQRQGPQVRASSDDFSNSVIVNAPAAQQIEVKDLLDKIDRTYDQPQSTVVYHLDFAVASDLQQEVANLLQSNQPRGRGGSNSQNNSLNPFQRAILGNNSQNTQVVADSRTNALVVTTTDDNQKIVARVIKDLDKPVDIQSSTLVFQLNNARADQVATLLQQAFGSRSGTNANSSNSNQARTPATKGSTSSSSGSRSTPSGLTGLANGNQVLAQTANSPAIDLAMADPNAASGELLTSVGVQGGFFFGQNRNQGFGGQNSSTNNSQSTGRDSQGRLVNVRDLVGQITVIPDQNTNSVIIVGTPDSAAIVKSILEQLDRIPQQVVIETIIVEATLTANEKLGVEWKFSQGSGGSVSQNYGLQSSSSTPTGLAYSVTTGNLSGFVNALKTDTKFSILSTPRIFTSNGVQSDINISQSIPYVTSQRTDTNGNISYTYSYQDVGVVLTVLPRITAGGYVTMDVSQTANDLDHYTDFNAPVINQRVADTTVSVKDGETVILGGIIRNTVQSTVSKIPLLGDIPFFGKLFRNSSVEKDKTELLVFLTPHIINNAEDARRLRDKSILEMDKENQQAAHKLIPKPEPAKPDLGNGGGQ